MKHELFLDGREKRVCMSEREERAFASA